MGDVENVRAHKTTDGKIFEDAEEAAAHQANLNRRKAVEEVVDDFFFHEMMREDVVNAILDNKIRLLDALR